MCSELETVTDTNSSDFEAAYDRQVNQILSEFENFSTNGSGWVVKNIESFNIDTTSFPTTTAGNSLPATAPDGVKGKFMAVPSQIRNSHCVVNPVTSSHCFQYRYTVT